MFYLGYPFWLQVLCLTFWWHRPQYVPCWQRGVQLICTRSGFYHQRNLPVPWRARNLPLLSHRYSHSRHMVFLTSKYITNLTLLFCLPLSPMLCPEYCGTFCYPNVSQSPYLHTVGEKLLPGIDILWTGEFEAWSQSRHSEDKVSLEMPLDDTYLCHNRSQRELVCKAKSILNIRVSSAEIYIWAH